MPYTYVEMDIIATHNYKRDFRNFWKPTDKLYRKPSLSVNVEGIKDHQCIANMFTNNFTVESPLGPSQRMDMTDGGNHGREFGSTFTTEDVSNAIKSMSTPTTSKSTLI